MHVCLSSPSKSAAPHAVHSHFPFPISHLPSFGGNGSKKEESTAERGKGPKEGGREKKSERSGAFHLRERERERERSLQKGRKEEERCGCGREGKELEKGEDGRERRERAAAATTTTTAARRRRRRQQLGGKSMRLRCGGTLGDFLFKRG